jgi:3-(3-hydroxy-phenyl)propionate hydroxylase
MTPTPRHIPIVILGAGPTGLVLANLLGTYGVPAMVLDRNPSTVDEPRAVSIDDESLRTLQTAGLVDEALTQIVQGYGVHYFSWSGKPFAKVEPTSREYGYTKRNAFRQAVLCAQLRDGLQRFGHIDVRFRHEVTSFSQTADGVRLEVDAEGTPTVITCDWLIGCDGGRSATRERLGIALTGNTFAEKWLIVDLLDRPDPFRHTRTYCDPARPAIRLPGPDGTVRYEFMLKGDETAEYVLDDARLRSWIAHREPRDAHLTIARKVVYTFHSRIAERWREGRVLLAGDAAHLTPPFAGQGMNSGVRDATNLAWKLAAVVRGGADASLLDTYASERKPHAWALIKMAMLIGKYMQPKSVMGAMAAQFALKAISLYPPARDYVLQLKFKPKPRFLEGFFVPDGAIDAPIRSGQLMAQPQVELPGGRRILLDDWLGAGFACVNWHNETAPVSWPSLGGLPCRTVRLVRQDEDFPLRIRDGDAVARDCDGVLAGILRRAQARAMVLRPDRYVMAFIADDDGPSHPSTVTAVGALYQRYGITTDPLPGVAGRSDAVVEFGNDSPQTAGRRIEAHEPFIATGPGTARAVITGEHA